jgi:small subunit ribosomal protein S1
MSAELPPDAPNPAPEPQEQPAAQQPPQPGGRRFGPPRPGGPGPRGPREFRPRDDRPKPPPLDKKEFGAFKPNKRDLDKSIEDELDAAMSGLNDMTWTSEPSPQKAAPGTPGQKKRGTIVGIHGKDVFVDVPGGRSQGMLPLQQFEGKTPKLGDVVEFDIEGYDAANGLLKLTMEGAAQAVTDWSSVVYGMIVEARVTDTNKNKTGLMVEVNGIKGFLPASQLDLYRVENLDQFVNQRLKVMIAEVNPEERNLIVSRRAVLERERQQKAEQFWATLEEGKVYQNVIVKSVKPFGAFVDLGGADGLIPVSELSWSRVENPEDVVKVGQLVDVKVLRIDPENRKIALSLKALHGNPWDDFARNHRPGVRVSGKVTRVADFGAFVELAPGIEGLLHVSELSNQHVRRVRDVVTEGQAVAVQILTIDPEARRIGLSLKAVTSEAEAAADEAAEAERRSDLEAAFERMANRPVNPNLRGGIGSNQVRFERE